MSNLLSSLVGHVRLFQEYLGKKMYYIFGLAVLGGAMESVGILMLFPLFNFLALDGQGGNNIELPLDATSQALSNFFLWLGVDFTLGNVLAVIAVTFLLKGLFMFLSLAFIAIYKGQLSITLMKALYRDSMLVRYSYFSQKNAGQFLSLIKDQVPRAIQAFAHLATLFNHTINSIVYLGLAMWIAWQFGLMAIAVGIFVLMILRTLREYAHRLSVKTANENGLLSNLLIQALQAVKYLKATDQLDGKGKNINDSIENLNNYQIRTSVALAGSDAMREPLIVMCILFIIYIQVVVMGQLLGPIMVALVLFYRGLNSVLSIQGHLQRVMEFIGSMDLVDKESRLLKKNQEESGAVLVDGFSEKIKMEGVFFSYGKNKEFSLSDINISISALTSTAIVGRSGSGKSTFADLLTLILRCESGRLVIDGLNSDELDLNRWRSQIGFVSQDNVIFNESIAKNISMQDDAVHSEETKIKIKKAAQSAYISEFIEALPDGYETQVGDRGSNLSGGQRQRIFIARELFRNPKLLILDEATSALDAESERAIQKSMDELRGQTTLIIIAHRLSTIRNVDQVLVLDNGTVIETGTFNDLKADKGSYFSQLLVLNDV